MKLNLVDEWRDAWKWISVNCMVLAGAVQSTWLLLDADQRAALPPYSATAITLVILACGILGRLVKQTPTPAPEPKP